MGKPDKQHFGKAKFGKGSFKARKIGSKLDGQGFAQSRKKKCLKTYGRFMKKRLKQKEEEDNIGLIMNDQGDLSKTKQKSNILNIARQKFKEEKKGKEEKRKEIEEARQQHTKAVKKNIEKRKKISKALSKRTKKGQPVMANQIKFMLDKIKTKS